MNVTCPDCKLQYDDTYRSTLCPHKEFEMHCTVYVDGKPGCAHTVEEQMASLVPGTTPPNPDCEMLKLVEEFEKQ